MTAAIDAGAAWNDALLAAALFDQDPGEQDRWHARVAHFGAVATGRCRGARRPARGAVRRRARLPRQGHAVAAAAGLPGGGGTPLASALDATRELVISLRRKGDTVLVVLLTNGRANAVASARTLRAMNVDALLIDTSPQPYP